MKLSGLMCMGIATAVACLIVAAPSQALVNKDDIVAVWLMDDKDATATDMTGNGYDGALIGGAEWVGGKFGGAVDLPGGGDVVRIEGMGMTFPNDEVTIMCWVNVQGVKNQDLFSFEPLAIAGGRVTAHMPWDGGIHWQFGTPFAGINPAPWNDDYIDQWKHWAFTVSPGDKKMLVYEDGAVVVDWDAGAELANGVADFQIGGRNGSSIEAIIDDFAIFQTVVSEADINRLKDQGLAVGLGYEAVDPAAKLTLTWAELRANK